MSPINRAVRFSVICLLLSLAACANSPSAKELERSFAADPRLETNAEPAADSSAEPAEPTAAAPPAEDEPPPAVGSITPSPNIAAAPQPGDSEFVGPVLPPEAEIPSPQATSAPATSAPGAEPLQFIDLEQAPEELRSYIRDLAELGVLALSATGNSGADPAQFQPNQAITRREFARWLVATNNRLYGDRPAHRIRLGTQAAQPAFQDVPRSDPDFAAIQGLAEAGVIPSPLSGEATTVSFRPDTPLTREHLILWKTPIDVRQTLPGASLEAVQQTWGFQDAARIDPKALRAVLADFQNGDTSNIRRAFGYTTLFQPKKTATRAEAAAVLWYFGAQGEGVSAQSVLQQGQVN